MNTGDTAWVLTSSALVLLMTLPGLALFYGGLVRRKNVLSILMQCFIIACVISLQWVIFGYSLSFGPRRRPWYHRQLEVVGTEFCRRPAQCGLRGHHSPTAFS